MGKSTIGIVLPTMQFFDINRLHIFNSLVLFALSGFFVLGSFFHFGRFILFYNQLTFPCPDNFFGKIIRHTSEPRSDGSNIFDCITIVDNDSMRCRVQFVVIDKIDCMSVETLHIFVRLYAPEENIFFYF